MMAPLNFSAPPAKPKIGFSIDSIVGDDSSPEKPPPSRQPTVTSAPQGSPPRSPGSPVVVRRGAWSPPAARPRSPLRSRSPLWPRSPMHSPKSASAELESAKLAAFQQQLQQLQLQRLHAPEPLHPALRPGLHALSLPHPLASLPRPPVSTPAGQPLPAAFGPAALGVGVGVGVGGLPPQTEYPLLPWLYSRQGRIFPSRFPGPDFPAFLLQPFRKPKRIRTAFSPSQLLKLEHAFENNHYVVGQERKQLAQSLNLSETQVKVWFQNRRTKHKRVQEEEGPAKSPGTTADADAGDEQADSLLTYDASDDDNIDVDADGDKPAEVAQ